MKFIKCSRSTIAQSTMISFVLFNFVFVKVVECEREDSLESAGSEPTEYRECHTRNRRQCEGTDEQNPVVLTKRYLPVKNHHEEGWKMKVNK